MNNNNELCIYLEHIPYESQYINNKPVEIIINTANMSINVYMSMLSPYLNASNKNPTEYQNKFINDINLTVNYLKTDKNKYINKLFNTFDVFSLGLSIIQILNYYINILTSEEKNIIFRLYDLIISKVFTYNIEDRITIFEFMIEYNNIIL